MTFFDQPLIQGRGVIFSPRNHVERSQRPRKPPKSALLEMFMRSIVHYTATVTHYTNPRWLL